MADGAYGAREIYIDLNIGGARVIRDPLAEGRFVKIRGFRINGTSGAAQGDIVLRGDSASGPIVFKEIAAPGTPFDGGFTPLRIRTFGLYMDALGAWVAGSSLIIYTD